MADIKDQSVADTGDPTVEEQAVQYWGDESNAEETQQAETPEVEASPELDPFEHAIAGMDNEAQEPESADDSEKGRFEYWQSRYDQKASEFETISQKLEDYDRIAPIAEYIQENPNVLQNVAKSLSGDEPAVPSQEKSQELPKKPARPTKPTNYDATEAYMDQESESFKYRAALDNYRDEMIDFQENQENLRIQEMQNREAAIVHQRQEYERTQAIDGMKGQLINEYGYEPQKADEFMQFYSSPESVTLENLVQLDKMRNSPSQAEVATRQKAQQMEKQSQRMAIPTPAGVQSGQAEPKFSDEDLFNLGLMAQKR